MTWETFHISGMKMNLKVQMHYDFRLQARVRGTHAKQHSEPLRIRKLYTTLKVYSCMKYNVFNCLRFLFSTQFNSRR